LKTIGDIDQAKADEFAEEFDIPHATDDSNSVMEDSEVNIVDIATSSDTHFELAMEALGHDKHVLCEKPVAHDYQDTLKAAEKAEEKDLKTKMGFEFRFTPAAKFARDLIDDGFVGRPFFFNGYEQNSQWLDPRNPLRQEDPDMDKSKLQTASLEGYGAPIIDIGHDWVGEDLDRVIGVMQNFIEERVVRDIEEDDPVRMNIDDGSVFLGEFENGTLSTIQTSFVTPGSYPGIEARIYGEEGAIIVRMIQEGDGPAEQIWTAETDPQAVDKAKDIEFVEREVPEEYYPEGGGPDEDWRTLFYANLVSDFLDELTEDTDRNRANFEDGAWVQKTINAVELSAEEDRWVDFPS